MRRLSFSILALSLVSGCGHQASDAALQPGTADQGDWVAFHTSSAPQRQYFYDRATLQRSGNLVRARWKSLNPGPPYPTTLYAIEIQCRENTFTELGTVLIDAQGRREERPRASLWANHPIEANTSTAAFRQMFCG